MRINSIKVNDLRSGNIVILCIKDSSVIKQETVYVGIPRPDASFLSVVEEV
jgi:hypothetical protein